MSKVPASPPGSKWRERRSGTDRRQKDGSNAQGRERRRSVEPRKPEVQELEMSLEEWSRLHGGSTEPPAG